MYRHMEKNFIEKSVFATWINRNSERRVCIKYRSDGGLFQYYIMDAEALIMRYVKFLSSPFSFFSI